jgi:hypothetical protein
MTDAVVEIVTASPGLKVREIGDSLRANGVPMQRGDDSKACQQADDSGRVRVEYGARNAKLHYPTNSGGLHLVPESPQ